MNTKLGQLLREERLKLNMSQTQFADYLDLDRSTYERLENDRNGDLKISTMIKVLQKLDIPLDIFIPVEILNKYCIYVVPKKESDVKYFLTKEFSKIVRKVERKFSKSLK